jgi:AraC-like DNA-binding protein
MKRTFNSPTPWKRVTLRVTKNDLDQAAQAHYCVAQWAANSNLCTRQLERECSRRHGLAPRCFLHAAAIYTAVQLLRAGKQVKDISHALCYTAHANFSRDFKQAFGLSARKFRRKPPKCRVVIRFCRLLILIRAVQED